MIVVLDTNVVLQALNPRHAYAPIMDAWYAGRFIWAVSTDILMEYREVIVRQSALASLRAYEPKMPKRRTPAAARRVLTGSKIASYMV